MKAFFYFKGSFFLRNDRQTYSKLSEYDEESEILSYLSQDVYKIKREIEEQLSKEINAKVVVDIQFQKGSIEWLGIIKIIWETVKLISNTGWCDWFC